MSDTTDDGDRIAKRLAEIKARVDKAMPATLNEAGKFLVGAITRPMRKGNLQLTGRLKSSIGHEVQGTRLKVGVFQSSKGEVLKYATIQHEGGTITGKPFLAIPIPYPGNPIFTKAGVSAVRASFVRNNPGQFGLESTFPAKGIIFGKLPGRRRKNFGRWGRWDIVPLYVLKRSVTIRAKKFIINPVTENLGRVRGYIIGAVRAAIRGED